MQLHRYKMGPLIIGSEIELPCAVVEDTGGGLDGVLRVVERLPKPSVSLKSVNGEAIVDDAAWLFDGDTPEVLVQSTGLMSVVRQALDCPGLSRIFSALRCLFIMKGMVLLHGSAVAKNGKAFVWLGGSGSGKSTRAAQECLHGAVHLCDDTVPIYLNQRGEICTFQSERFANLVEQLDGSVRGLPDDIPGSSGKRDDGKGFYRLTQAYSDECRIERVEHIQEQGRIVCVNPHSDEFLRRTLISIAGLGEMQRVLGEQHVMIVAALMRQLRTHTGNAGW